MHLNTPCFVYKQDKQAIFITFCYIVLNLKYHSLAIEYKEEFTKWFPMKTPIVLAEYIRRLQFTNIDCISLRESGNPGYNSPSINILFVNNSNNNH